MEKSEIQTLLFVLFNLFVYIFRNRKPFDKIWYYLQIFWLVLLAFLTAGYIKDKFK